MMDYEDIIDVQALAELIKQGECRVIDCRFNLMQPMAGRADYESGHIPTAVYADLDRDLAAEKTPDSGRHPLPEPDDFIARLGTWGIGNNSQIVVYDDASGALAARLWWMLNWLGHRRIAVLDGGYKAWLNAGYPVQTETPDYSPTTFSGHANNAMVVTTDEVAAMVDAGGRLNLVDARDHARFAGQTEPIDRVAGHVPGATNLPFTVHLSENGQWRSQSELVTSWNSALGESGTDQAIVMCGSGVTACHLALSARLAGLEMPRVYVGSWSEWVADPGRPVATGDAA